MNPHDLLPRAQGRSAQTSAAASTASGGSSGRQIDSGRTTPAVVEGTTSARLERRGVAGYRWERKSIDLPFFLRTPAGMGISGPAFSCVGASVTHRRPRGWAPGVVPPCPPNGLARAAWCREFAARVSDERVRAQQIACAERIEARELAKLPLFGRLPEDG